MTLTGVEAYRQLQALAKSQGRNTQELFELYIHERFLARVAASDYNDRLILKGGMLLAVIAERRATRDADMLAQSISNDQQVVREMVTTIAEIDLGDGVEFQPGEISTTPIQEDADYEGVRVAMPAHLDSARLKFKLDLSFGDPVSPVDVDYPGLLTEGFKIKGFSTENVIAEKVETMMFLGDANTRDRDYGDVYMLSGLHAFQAETLRKALAAVAYHRKHEIRPLGPLLVTLPDIRQGPWLAFRERAGLPALPESFAEVVDAVSAFVDPLTTNEAQTWDPAARRWA